MPSQFNRLSFYRTAFLCAAVGMAGRLGFADLDPVSTSTSTVSYTPEQLDSMVAPIALYPDSVVSQILVATTYPLEIVQAYQWLQQHPDLKGQALTDAASKESWDSSVQALVVFPDVMKRLNEDITWTTNLGNAVLADQSAVMDSIQRLRTKAEQAGKLKSDQNMKVENTTDNGQQVVQIEPANPEVIYVPDYDPAWIWGPPPPYYPYPYWYYPAPPPVGIYFYWGAPISIGFCYPGWHSWVSWGWRPHWYSRTVVVNNVFVNRYHFNTVHVVNAPRTTVWTHAPVHRMGVAYPNRALWAHYRSNIRFNPAMRSQLNAVHMQAQMRGASARAARSPGIDRIGGRQVVNPGYNRNHTAFGHAEAGAAARAHSVRGYSSLGARGGGRRGVGDDHSGDRGSGLGGGHR